MRLCCLSVWSWSVSIFLFCISVVFRLRLSVLVSIGSCLLFWFCCLLFWFWCLLLWFCVWMLLMVLSMVVWLCIFMIQLRGILIVLFFFRMVINRMVMGIFFLGIRRFVGRFFWELLFFLMDCFQFFFLVSLISFLEQMFCSLVGSIFWGQIFLIKSVWLI